MTPLVPLSELEDAPPVPPRRRRNRAWLPFLGREDYDTALEDLSQRAFPHLDFYLLTILTAALLGLAYLLQSPALVVLAAVSAPVFGPLAGLALGVVTLSPSFALRNLAALAIAAVWAFAASLLVIGVGRFLGLPAAGAPTQDVPGLFLAAPAAALFTIQFIRSSTRLPLANAMVAYLFLAPLAAAAWRFAAGEADGIPADLIHLGLVWLLTLTTSAVTFCALGFRPTEKGGRAYAGAAGAVLVTLIALGAWVILGQTAAPREIPVSVATPTATASLSAAEATPTPTVTLTREPTATATETPGPTDTPTPSPVPAVVAGTGEQGANLRDAPDGAIIASAMDGETLWVTGPAVVVNGKTWIPVRNIAGTDAWMVEDYCATITPTPAATKTAAP
ncbi:MAG: hypothetical protein EHM12_12050 [Dehalococcoidia bacterium]|nr:MAG: hypothetical protein EHM12_12050 [Dehalococcoidia bacterium]